MASLLTRKQNQKSGIKRGPERVWPKHEKFVRTKWDCIAAKVDGKNCSGRVQCCHYLTAANSGKGLKAGSWWTFPACAYHHLVVQHTRGQKSFERRYDVKLEDECRELVRRSPDIEMKAEMREAGLL